MTRTRTLHRWTFAALSAAALTLTIAQAASADPGWRRGRHAERGRWGYPERRVVYREVDRGGAGPALFGLIGGFVLGATLTHPQPVVVHEHVCAPPPSTRYYRQDDYAPPPPSRNCDPDENAPAPPSRNYHQDENTPAPPPASYRYEDISGERWWDTLDEAREAAGDRGGPRVIRVIDARNDRCVETLYWSHDHFISDQDRDSNRGDDNRDR